MRNTILKMMTDGTEDELDLLLSQKEFEEFSKKDVKEFRNIPIDAIKNRKYNDYSIGNIEELANSIMANGLQQNIIVKAVDDYYVLIAGERRLTAYEFIVEKLKKEGKDYSKYLTIPAEVYTSISAKTEEAIYKDTNDTARNSSLFERVYRFYPSDKFFNLRSKYSDDNFIKGNEADVNKIADYINLKANADDKYKFKEDASIIANKAAEAYTKLEEGAPFVTYANNVNGEVIRIDWSKDKTMYDYIYLKLASMYPDMKLSSGSVRRYAVAIQSCYKPIIQDFVLKQNVLSPKDILQVSALSEEEQKAKYQDLKDGKSIKFEQKEQATEDIPYEAQFNNYVDSIIRLAKVFEEKDFNGHKSELTGNQKEILKDIRSIVKKVSEMSKKSR